MSAPLVIAYAFLADRLAPGGVLHSSLTSVGVRSYGSSSLFTGTIPAAVPWRDGVVDARYLLLTNPVAGQDLRPNYTRVLSDPEVIVRVIGRTRTYIDLNAAAIALDALLDGFSGTNALGTVWYCQRQQAFSMESQTPNGEEVRHLGYRYQFVIQG